MRGMPRNSFLAIDANSLGRLVAIKEHKCSKTNKPQDLACSCGKYRLLILDGHRSHFAP